METFGAEHLERVDRVWYGGDDLQIMEIQGRPGVYAIGSWDGVSADGYWDDNTQT